MFGIADAGQDVVVQAVRLGHVGLDGEDGEPHLLGQERDHARLPLKELGGAVGAFAKAYDLGVANHLLERLEIREIGIVRIEAGERKGVVLDTD